MALKRFTRIVKIAFLFGIAQHPGKNVLKNTGF